MDVHLTAAQTASWANNDWRSGWQAAMQDTVPTDVRVVRVYSNTSTLLATYTLVWTAT